MGSWPVSPLNYSVKVRKLSYTTIFWRRMFQKLSSPNVDLSVVVHDETSILLPHVEQKPLQSRSVGELEKSPLGSSVTSDLLEHFYIPV